MLEQAKINAEVAGVSIEFIKTNGTNFPGENYDAIAIWGQLLGEIELEEDQRIILEESKRILLSVSIHEKTETINNTPRGATDSNFLYPWGKRGMRYHLSSMGKFVNLIEAIPLDVIFAEQPDSLRLIIHLVAKKTE